MKQTEVLLAALMRGEELTPIDALSRYGVLALSQRIGELVRQGHPIERDRKKTRNGKRVGLYRWAGQRQLW